MGRAPPHAGGTAPLVSRAIALAGEGDMRTACDLIELAAKAAPDDANVHAARADLYAMRRRAATSSMAKGIFEDADRASAEAGGIEPPDMSRDGAAPA